MTCMCVLVGVPSLCSCDRLFVTPWTVGRQPPLSVGFSRQEYWSGLPCPSQEDLPDLEIEAASLTSPALAGRLFTLKSLQSSIGPGSPVTAISKDVMCRKD